jgi:mRNA-degrading endonuclease RelE of RelBE toxin-antitoxin system
MAYHITITDEADSHLRALPAHDRRILEAAIVTRLTQQPTVQTRAIKRLRPNPLAEYELRAGDLRVLYNVEGSEVVLLVIGRKAGNKLIVKGQVFHGHQDNPPESP